MAGRCTIDGARGTTKFIEAYTDAAKDVGPSVFIVAAVLCDDKVDLVVEEEALLPRLL